MTDWSDEETDNPLRADDRNFYKVEKWTKDGMKVDRMLYAGNNLDKAREIFVKAIKHRAADKVDHPAEDAGARAVAARTCAGRLSYHAAQLGLRNFYSATNFS